MESEEKLIELEPYKREEHKTRFRELRERLKHFEKQYEMQFPMINMIDDMVKANKSLTYDEDNARIKAASTSLLDQVSYEDDDRKNLSSLQQDKEILERTLEDVKSKVTISGGNESANLDKLRHQQYALEGICQG